MMMHPSGLETAPRDTEQGRALFQARLATYGRVGMLMSIVFLTLAIAIGFLFDLPARLATASAETGGIVVGAATWLVARGGRRETNTLVALDCAATLVFCAIFIALGFAVPITGRPELIQLVCVGNILGLRAFLVPSTTRRTLALGVASMAAVVACTQFRYSTEVLPADWPAPEAYSAIAAVFASAPVFITSFTSRTIFGLRERVRAAMQVGQYTLLERIGAGGMGVVYRATHAMLKRPTAVKLLPPERAGEENIRRFEREVQLTAELTHPNTVAIYDYGRTADGTFYYAMELLDGIDLETLVALGGAQEPSRVVHILAQIAGALAEAHGIGLIHRDMKPANVLLGMRRGGFDVVKIVDFGLAKSLDAGRSVSETGTDRILGTPLYLAPEAVTTPERVGPESDVYGLGALAYHLLAGEPPFSGRTAVELCGHHLHTAPVPPFTRLGRPGPAELEALVLACLEKQPAARPDVLTFARRLAACPGIPAWTEHQARAFWDVQADAIREHRRRQRHLAGSGDGAGTLAIDLTERARPGA